jgi:hypothetical protein
VTILDTINRHFAEYIRNYPDQYLFNNISGQGMANPLRVIHTLRRAVGSFL